MHTVLVKHYLSPKGIAYALQNWFSQVYSIMSQQDGFIAFEHESHKDIEDCINFSVTFKNQPMLERWASTQAHDALVNALDPFRSRGYWEYCIIKDASNDHVWEKVIIK